MPYAFLHTVSWWQQTLSVNSLANIDLWPPFLAIFSPSFIPFMNRSAAPFFQFIPPSQFAAQPMLARYFFSKTICHCLHWQPISGNPLSDILCSGGIHFLPLVCSSFWRHSRITSPFACSCYPPSTRRFLALLPYCLAIHSAITRATIVFPLTCCLDYYAGLLLMTYFLLASSYSKRAHFLGAHVPQVD
jgi:hypothetical protein